MSAGTATLPAGTLLRPLTTHPDARGTFTELYREEWDTGVRPVQWNAVASEAGVLRGVHVHVKHADYLTLVRGRAAIGLRDLRRDSPTSGLAACVELDAAAMEALAIPPGVAHGFLFLEPSIHVYAVSRAFDPEDELGCHWADPELGIAWPEQPSLVSERDSAAGSLAAVMARLERHQAAL